MDIDADMEVDVDIKTVYSGGFDVWYNQHKVDFSWGKLDNVIRLPIVGSKWLNPPIIELPEFLEPLQLLSEPDNPADPNAISVLYRNLKVGWLTREKTFMIRKHTWKQTPYWSELPKLINSRWGLYAVGV